MHRVPSFRVSRNSQEELVRESQTDVGKSKGVSAVFRFLVRNIYFEMFVVCSVRIYDEGHITNTRCHLTEQCSFSLPRRLTESEITEFRIDSQSFVLKDCNIIVN